MTKPPDISQMAWEAAGEAYRTSPVKVTGGLEAAALVTHIARAIDAADAKARMEQREALNEARHELWTLGLAVGSIAKWPRSHFNRRYVEEWAIRTATILHRWGMDFEAVLTVEDGERIKDSRLTTPEIATSIRNQDTSR